jgi:hypothetical protein
VHRIVLLVVGSVLGAWAAPIVGLAAESSSPAPRVAAPAWSREVRATFFPDARRELVGTRPAGDVAAPREGGPATTPASAASGPEFAWSQRIDAEALTAEIKRLTNELAAPLANPSRFKSGGFQDCRRNFSVLAVLFGVAEQYDESLTLQRDAQQLRQLLARAGRNAKVATDQSFAEGRNRKADLDDALGGQRLAEDAAEAEPLVWSELAERPVLMQRMEALQQEGIGPLLANEGAFRREAARVREQAQVLGVLGEVVQREAFEYWDDETYAEFARSLVQASAELADAAQRGDYAAAREAAGRITQSCSQCHEGYRG